jgi:hypothetical protein
VHVTFACVITHWLRTANGPWSRPGRGCPSPCRHCYRNGCYGRGPGVGRGRGEGPALGVGVGRGVELGVDVGEGLALGVAVGVGLAVGVGVGLGEPGLVCQMYVGNVSELPVGFVEREHRGKKFHVYQLKGVTMVFWQDRKVVCVLISDMPTESVVQLAFAKAPPL